MEQSSCTSIAYIWVIYVVIVDIWESSIVWTRNITSIASFSARVLTIVCSSTFVILEYFPYKPFKNSCKDIGRLTALFKPS